MHVQDVHKKKSSTIIDGVVQGLNARVFSYGSTRTYPLNVTSTKKSSVKTIVNIFILFAYFRTATTSGFIP